jgi:hypothetical protein
MHKELLGKEQNQHNKQQCFNKKKMFYYLVNNVYAFLKKNINLAVVSLEAASMF